jgi:hypothetical protein
MLVSKNYSNDKKNLKCLAADLHIFFLKDPIYLQSVIIHSENGGKGEGWHVEEYSVALQNESEIQFVPHRNHIR